MIGVKKTLLNISCECMYDKAFYMLHRGGGILHEKKIEVEEITLKSVVFD